MEKKAEYSRENHARSAEDVPFFPLAVAIMSQGQYTDEIAEAQHDFVRSWPVTAFLVLRNQLNS